MKVRRFTKADIPLMNQWYTDRGMDKLADEVIPAIGFIADAGCGFLYVTEGRQIGLLEGYITPQAATHNERQESLDLVTKALIDEAKELKVLKLLAFTTSQGVFDRAVRNDFKYVDNFSCLVKALN